MTKIKQAVEKPEQVNAYLWMKALDFLRNYINHCESYMMFDTSHQTRFFDIITMHTDLAGLRKSICKIFDKHFKTKGKEEVYDYDLSDFEHNINHNIDECIQVLWNHIETREDTHRLLIREIDALQKHYRKFLKTSDTSRKRCEELQKFLQLSDEEMEIALQRFFVAENFLGETDDMVNLPAICQSLQNWIEIPACRIQELCTSEGNLIRYKLLDADLYFNSFPVRDFLFGMTKEPLSTRYFKRVQEEPLPWDYFDEELRQNGELLKEIIRCNAGKKPVNILLYGAPGTGKTSFAKTLARELGVEAFLIAQDTKQGGGGSSGCAATSDPHHRFAAVQVCSMQVKPQSSVMIVDEADEMLNCAEEFNSADKGLLNSILDRTIAPTIWIANIRKRDLDESNRRRFDYSIEFATMDASQRKNIWKNNIKKFNLDNLISDELIEQFSDDYAISAGGISQALSNLANIKPEKKAVEAKLTKILERHCELMNVPFHKSKDNSPVRDYTLEGLNVEGKTSPEQIVRAMGNYLKNRKDDPDTPRMNLMLSGPAGSGKTEFVKYLGQKLHKRVIVKMGSDLLDCLVGNTEKHIAAAFKEAEKADAILFFDEIDGMVQSRTRAHENWEVSQVNEFLYCMENFNGIMIGASNFMENLDSAILRRFTFKFKFDYLTKDGKEHFFKSLFKRELTAEERVRLAGIPRLTPGDYRTVRQSLFYLDCEMTNADYLDALEKESNCKQDNRSAVKTRIGFSGPELI